MSQQGSNLRLRRTQKLLREALIELIEERGFEALTVGEIAERAMVSRAAFYRNYEDKYHLVEQIFDEAMGALHGAVAQMGREHPPQIWVRFFEHIAEYDRLYRALLGRKGSPWFVMKMRVSMMELVREHGPRPMGPEGPGKPVKAEPPGSSLTESFVPDLISTMFVEAVTWWLEQGRPYAPQEIATRCALLVSAIFKETGTWD